MRQLYLLLSFTLRGSLSDDRVSVKLSHRENYV